MTATETQARRLSRLLVIHREMNLLAEEAAAISCHGIRGAAPITAAWHAAHAAQQLAMSLPYMVTSLGECLEIAQQESGLTQADMSGLPHPLPCDDLACKVCRSYRPAAPAEIAGRARGPVTSAELCTA